MVMRKALTGLQRIARSNAVTEAIASTEIPVAARVAPSALQLVRSFAAQPAAAPEVGSGKVTQVCARKSCFC